MATPIKSSAPVTKKTTHNTFRNFMILILVTLLLWSWFNYLPDQAINTLESVRAAASRQIDTWIWVSEPVQVINQPYVINPESMSTWENTTGEVMSGDTTTWWQISAGRSADQEVLSGETTGSSIRNEIDTMIAEPNDSTLSSDIWLANEEPNPVEPLTDKVINIEIGWQIVTIDGTPEEDVIINAGSYRVIVQKK